MQRTKCLLNCLTINNNDLYLDENNRSDLPLITPFVEKRKYMDHLTLYIFKGTFGLLQADIADRFLAKSAINPKYCLLFVDFCHFKNLYLLCWKKAWEVLWWYLWKKTRGQKMRLQTDQEFHQNNIKKLNVQHNVMMFSKKVKGGKVFAAKR